MITIEKLNIYRRYEGNEDEFARSGITSEQKLVDDIEWGIITDSEHNIELIAKGLTSVEFRNTTIQGLQKKFDNYAFSEITKPISLIILEMNNSNDNSKNA